MTQEITLVTGQEMARIIGVTPQALNKATLAGRIEFEKQDGRRKFYDKQKTLDAWGKKSLPSNGGARNKKVSTESYVDAERREKRAKADLAELKAKQLGGELIEKLKVDRFLFESGRKVRNAILDICPRLAPELAAETDPHKLEVKLNAELVAALEELANGIDP